MRKLWITGLVMILAVLLAGCGGDKEATPVPSPTETQFQPSPLPPEWTATPPGFVASPTSTPEVTATLESVGGALNQTGTPGGNFPPTWTPAPTRTQGPPPTPRPLLTRTPTPEGLGPTLPPPAPTWTPLPEVCNQFYVLGGDVQVQIGLPATIAWNPVPGMTGYLVEVRHPGGTVVHSHITTDSQYAIPAENFTVAGVYGWEAVPIDADDNRACFPISGEIFASFGPPQTPSETQG